MQKNSPDTHSSIQSQFSEGLPHREHLILVVDDVRDNLRLLRGFLADEYRLSFATNGQQALTRVKAAQPDLILLDLMMPEMNGLEVCQRLQQFPETAAIPVIFLTASQEMEDLAKAFKHGAVDYVTKPFRVPELLARLKTHLELVDLRRQLADTTQQLRVANEALAQFRRSDQ
jgi:CheY-like chemotaxis protein